MKPTRDERKDRLGNICPRVGLVDFTIDRKVRRGSCLQVSLMKDVAELKHDL